MTKHIPLVAIVAISLLGACSHHGSRSFSMNGGPSQPTEPTPENPEPTPEPQPAPPTPPPSGTLTRTTDTVTNVTGGVLHVAGNTLLGLSNHTNLPGGAGQLVDGLGHSLANNGVGGLPIVGGTVEGLVQGVDNQLNSVAQVQVVGLPIIGASQPSGNQAIGIGVGSATPPTATVAAVSVLNQGAQQPLGVSLGNTQVIGTPGAATINVDLLNGGGTTPSQPGRSPTGVLGTVVNTLTGPILTPPPGGR